MKLVIRKYQDKYDVSVEYKDPLTGKRRFKREALCKTREEAELKKKKLERSGLWIDVTGKLYPQRKETWTLGECILAELERDSQIGYKKSSSTQNSYRRIFENHIKNNIGDIIIDKVTPDIVQDLIDDKAKKYALSTINIIFIVIQKGIDFAMRKELIDKNIMLSVKKWGKEAKTNAAKNYLSSEELLNAINNCEDRELKLMMLISATTGIRESEVLALSWDSIDFENNILIVNKIIVRNKDGKVELQNFTKNKQDIIISIPNILREELLKYKNEWNEKIDKKENMLFSKKGELISVQLVSGRFKSYMKKQGHENITFHGLRHSYATMLFENGQSIEGISLTLNHKNRNTTEKVYIHLTDKYRNNTKNIVDNIFK